MTDPVSQTPSERQPRVDSAPTVAVVGAGIVGLAHAWAAAREGCRVVVFERGPRALGASIRNFGMVWPIGQPAGDRHRMALLSRELWLEFARASGTWIAECGSIHLARRADELAVLEEFAAIAPSEGYDCQLLVPDEVVGRSPATRASGLLGGLWSPTELCVDPRTVLRTLPAWLRETHGVEFHYETAIVGVDERNLLTAAGVSHPFDLAFVCSGTDFETLFPETFATSGLVRCKLQMLRTVPQPGGWRLGPHLAGGLTLRHYGNFESCASLPALRQRVAEETPDLDRYGIHVMASQNAAGEVVLGDSHEYGDAIEPFDKERIDRLVLDELSNLMDLPDWTIAARWHGFYAKHPTAPFFTAEPRTGVHVVTGLGGAGMTMSFGLADERVAAVLSRT